MPVLVGAFLAMTLVLGWLTRIIYHMDALAPPEPSTTETYPGVKLSKGGTRAEGWRALREMLQSSPEAPQEDRDQSDEPRDRSDTDVE